MGGSENLDKHYAKFIHSKKAIPDQAPSSVRKKVKAKYLNKQTSDFIWSEQK